MLKGGTGVLEGVWLSELRHALRACGDRHIYKEKGKLNRGYACKAPRPPREWGSYGREEGL